MAVDLTDYAHTAAQRGWGAGWPSCAGAKGNLVVVTAKRSGVRVSVHRRISRLVALLIDETERRGELAKSGQTGAFNCRPISGTSTPSNHSWGLAVDWNWQDNPFTTNLSLNHIPAWMPALWARYGFAWGGSYRGKRDFMHWEFMGTPADADALTALALIELSPAAAPAPPAIPGAPVAPNGGDHMSTIVPLHFYRVDPRGALIRDDAGLSFRGTLPAEAGAGSAAVARAFVRWRAHWGTAKFRVVAWSATAPIREVDTSKTDWWELPPEVRSFTVEGTREHSAVEVAASLIEIPR